MELKSRLGRFNRRETIDLSVAQEPWEFEEVLGSGPLALEAWRELIQQAKARIDFEVYIFQQDACGDGFVELLCSAALRGVSVRLIVDGVGSLGFSRAYGERLQKSKVQFRIFHPTPYDASQVGPSVEPNMASNFVSNIVPEKWWLPWSSGWKLLGRLNKRNHRKFLIRDQEEVVVGSANVAQVHRLRTEGGQAWRDCAARVRGRAVSSFVDVFESSWNSRSLDRLPALVPAMFNVSTRLRRLRHLFLLELIYRSQTRVWITNAYFVPDGSLLKALRFAAWTGVDVKVIVPQKSDIIFMRLVTSALYLGLLTAGVRIFEYRPSVLHAKTLLVDSLAIVGTSNLNHRSLLHDLEVDVLLKHESSMKSLENSFQMDLNECLEVSFRQWRERPWWDQLMGRLLLAVRYWL